MDNSKNKFNRVVYQKSFQALMQDKKISLVAPASAVDEKELDALASLTKYYIDICIPDNLIDKCAVFYSNTDQKRFYFLKKALLNKSQHQIVWALRGGYGSARLIEALNKIPKPKHEKVFIGFSDITALHLFLSQRWGWKTIHGSVLNQFLSAKRDPNNFKKLAEILADPKKTRIALNDLMPLNAAAAKAKKIRGPLTGGNLTLVESSIGTDWQIKTTGKILFLEDHKEAGYKLDRSLNHLKQAGLLKGVHAVIFGNFDQCPNDINIALERFAQETRIPIFKSDQFGHGAKNYPLIYNAIGEILKEKACHFYLQMKPGSL